ncbi:hypothetical protein [Novosphingobium sp.]|uniref:hypothetical protein n=1 Tax=Novosphingobium sp. TaxID=1874826 RepID=UPI002608373C|nr:hypothetical protein [Novosphingobium sp.]
MNTAISAGCAPAPTEQAFDPGAWLAAWEASGGGWTVIGGAPVLCCPVRDAKPGLRISDAMAELDRLGQRSAVLAEVMRRSAPLSVEG